jgi:hypothetical protein
MLGYYRPIPGGSPGSGAWPWGWPSGRAYGARADPAGLSGLEPGPAQRPPTETEPRKPPLRAKPIRGQKISRPASKRLNARSRFPAPVLRAKARTVGQGRIPRHGPSEKAPIPAARSRYDPALGKMGRKGRNRAPTRSMGDFGRKKPYRGCQVCRGYALGRPSFPDQGFSGKGHGQAPPEVGPARASQTARIWQEPGRDGLWPVRPPRAESGRI